MMHPFASPRAPSRVASRAGDRSRSEFLLRKAAGALKAPKPRMDFGPRGVLGQGPGLKAPQVDVASDLVLLLRCRPSRLRRLRRRLRRKTRRPNRVSVRHAQSVFQFQAELFAEVVPEAKESHIFPGTSRSIFQHMPSARCPRPRTRDGDLRASPLRGRGADSDPLPFLADAHLSSLT